MPKYEIIYDPKSRVSAAGLEEEVFASYHQVEGRFITFYHRKSEFEPGEVILRIASSQVLQIKTVSNGEDGAPVE